MSTYRFQRDADPGMPPAWRALDRALFQWVRAHGGSEMLARVAAWASHADGLGDAALWLQGEDAGRHGVLPLNSAELDGLRAQDMVGDGSRVTPFVLDAEGRFALWRNHAHEVAIAAQIRARRDAGEGALADEDDLRILFRGDDSDASRRQREAVARVGGRRLFVLTGGPGTGKTTTVLRMLLMRLRQALDMPPVIQVAAPTGKAAQRLAQALREGKRLLGSAAPKELPEEWQPLLAHVPDGEALTVHRLLGFDPRRNRYTRHAHRPIAADIVVVDEASMLDLSMLRALLDAVRPDAALILVGDADQLTSVATGSVLMDLVAALERDGADELVRLDHSFRADRELARINAAVRGGDAAIFEAAFAAAGARAVRRNVVDATTLRRVTAGWAAEVAELPIRPILPASSPQQDAFADLDSASGDMAHRALRALGRRQLLCALREERYGALIANALIESELKRLWQVPADALWYPGRAVLITRNDYSQRLFNGDVGLCLADAEAHLKVWFDTLAADGRSTARAIAPSRLPLHEGAFAITVHKSQGSEYDHVAVLLPPDPDHRILSRQLLYTALSRARRGLELWVRHDVAEAAIKRPIRRVGGLISLFGRGSV
jgi:exodeoxyribonuclease V alpha subunit